MGQRHDRVQTESQALHPWTAVSTWLGQHGVAAARSKATCWLTDHLLNAHVNDFLPPL